MKNEVYQVKIGQKCKKCGKDLWTVKRAYKVCSCGQKCWLRKIQVKGSMYAEYLYFQGDTPPPDAIVTSPEEDRPYQGKG